MILMNLRNESYNEHIRVSHAKG